IQGDMVHPYLKRRRGAEPVQIPAPSPQHGPPDELSSILGRTLGVPIFQEQAMKIALDAAKFSSKEANRLRKAMATFRSRGMVDELQDMMVERMVTRGYERDFAQRCFNQIRGFGEYGFPESHAASFAHLVYVSSWLKCHFPAAFAAALLNSQPMGFYAPAQIVRDAREHGVEVLPVDVNHSQWDCTLEDIGKLAVSRRDRRGVERRREVAPAARSRGFLDGSSDGKSANHEDALGTHDISASPFPLRSLRETSSGSSKDQGRQDKHIALRLGLRQVDGLPEHVAALLIAERTENGPFRDVAELRERAGLSPAHIERLASADCFTSLEISRRKALWDARSLIAGPDLPLFRAADTRDEGAERRVTKLPTMPLSEEVVADYQTTRLSLKAHPMSFLRPDLAERGFVRACDLRNRKFRSMVQVAGVVLIRQRPGSAKGVCFITLEDETGVINLVVWPDLKEKQRKVVMGARLMEVRGRVEYDDEVIHVIAQTMTDATAKLYALSDDMLDAPVARADHVNSPISSHKMPASRATIAVGEIREEDARSVMRPREIIDALPLEPEPNVKGHPRNHRIIPKSRDFH
ncbi:MAG: OB-fold nucleic acid binding domain-containing protein, partial [Pseudomonadota bacterium]